MKRIISLLLAVIMAASVAVSAGAASTASASGKPIVVTKTITAHFNMEREYQRTYQYSDHFFDGSAYQFNNDLARLSLALAGVAGRKEYFDPFFPQIGLQNVEYNKWMTSPSEQDSIGVSIGTKKLKDTKGDYTLIVAPIRGSSYHSEAGGDVNVGPSGEFRGFAIGRDKALDFIQQYIQKHHITGRIKFWSAGYSRGASVANLLGGTLDDAYAVSGQRGASSNARKSQPVKPLLGQDITLSPDDIFIYTYESPLAALDTEVQDVKYDNIHNIVNPSDIVTAVLFREWGMARYGVDHLTPTKSDPNYSQYKSAFLGAFQQDPNILYTTYWPDYFQAWHVDRLGNVPVRFSRKDRTAPQFFRDLGVALTNSFVTSRQDYADNLEGVLTSILDDLGRENQDANLQKAGGLFLQTVQTNWTALFGALLQPDQTATDLVLGWLLDSFKSANVTSYNLAETRAALNVLIPRLRTFASKYPDEAATLLSNILNVVGGHFIGSTDSWLRTLPDDYYGSHTAYSYKS